MSFWLKLFSVGNKPKMFGPFLFFDGKIPLIYHERLFLDPKWKGKLTNNKHIIQWCPSESLIPHHLSGMWERKRKQHLWNTYYVLATLQWLSPGTFTTILWSTYYYTPFYRWENWDLTVLSNLLQTKHLESGEAGIWTHVCRIPQAVLLAICPAVSCLTVPNCGQNSALFTCHEYLPRTINNMAFQ